MPANNIIIAQSGGPSAVINNTLRGIIESCRAYPGRFGEIYAGWHGIEGILKEELLNLSAQAEEEIKLLKTTPGAGSIGTCRYKLGENQEEDFSRIVDVFRTHDIGYSFCVGGNDSQHTALRISKICSDFGLEVISVGVPKTIDNDLGDKEFKLIDHTPGYGSVARYWAHMVQSLDQENSGSYPSDPVLVVQAMGRRIGFIPAAARLADPDREMPLQIYLAESKIPMPELAENVNDYIKRHKRCIVVVSEGYDTGEIADGKDSFGHTQYGSGGISAQQIIVNYLNKKGLRCRGSVRGQVPGTDQRHAMIYASTVDLDEAYEVGRNAVEIALNDGNGWMSTILRDEGHEYRVRYDKVPLESVALSERSFPEKWISVTKHDVNDQFVEYAKPLIGEKWIEIPLEKGLQRFTRFEPLFVEKKLTRYIPQAY
ncbi:MAG TPA: diphosphate--fructose-6-phosphate 1-phosphotransferase [Bacteroidales bacterium]|nr:diphosphate--fructose-6-phosphate 1-phosphotransferase [Bacteroidales bacterium]